MDLSAIIKAAKAYSDGEGLRPVEKWEPDYCGEMDMVIRADGSWWHEGTRITREPLIKLFASILRKDEDGETYLVTPIEKIKIVVEKAHFIATRIDVEAQGKAQRVFLTTNMGDVVEVGPENPIRVEIDADTDAPTPYVRVRGRLEALLTRPAFYEMVEHSEQKQTEFGTELGIYASGHYFPIGKTE